MLAIQAARTSYNCCVKLTFLTILLTMSLLTMPVNHARAASTDGWDAALFQYDRSERLPVEVTTPTGEQVAWIGRPAQMPAGVPAPEATDKPVEPRTVGPVDILHLKFRDADGEVVPALLATPAGKKGPFPVVIAVHGLTSNKAQVVAQLAPALARHGFAVIAPDMPRHGERPGEPWSILDASKPVKTFELFRQIVRDVRMCIDIAERRPELDTKGGVVLMGYSMGSWINAVAGPADERVKAMVLMVGGAHDVRPAMLPIAQLRATDPRTAIPNFAPRPLLLLNGKLDSIVTPAMGRRLFAACDADSSEQRWYDCGHLLTNKAYEDAADWVAAHAPAKLSSAAPATQPAARRKAG
jgi:dienelactone hydrolase